MQIISDILLAAGAIAAAVYCLVLSRRLKRFTRLEGGMGGAIAVLSAQVDELTRALKRAEAATKASAGALDEQMARAAAATNRLELLLAAMHDLPDLEEIPRTMSRRSVRRNSTRSRYEVAE
ncbi:hypothetical protein ACFQXB_00345 [Plastorhodobacter daqingensis]|uniref:Chemotaxis protein n=1 Tax=Plastorhodobacter daqingensis TaxID=1387281 RepID=A0ABW2UGB9_9RHOB